MLNINVQGGDYSIDSFLDYLQETGYYDLIQVIKNTFGDNVAIDVCKELAKNSDCECLVRVYMIKTDGSGMGKITPGHIHIENNEEILEYFEKKYKINGKMRKLIEVILRFYYILWMRMKLLHLLKEL